ncbi:uncharacterized protein LOC114255687 [Monomorium pharaonis]|uniref:uncharacterized protein LOC114255687 n=1 Tax=Monomorium pharaonis TaxID=307658 RepID=UPI0017470CCE|nr:uncharacterized protein LOC114255687 [Monomorium pharaonis]
MPWKVGGNFETVAITCETNWKECVIAVANYLWSEVVSDVVDYLAKEGIMWVLAIAIASVMFIRIKYCKTTHAETAALNKRILNKVRYKIQDLELKINVLTYKMQYGTWPLPHQICTLNPKLRKIRMTLSNPGDRKTWLKHLLLNPSLESNVYAPSSKASHSSNYFDIKQECAPHVKRSELLTTCSSIETLKSSDQSVNKYSWRPGTPSQNATKENNLSKNKDFILRRNAQLLPLESNMTNYQSSGMIPHLTQNDATNAKYNPCQEFTDTICKCKSFLKELRHNDKCLPSLDRSSKISKIYSLKPAHAAKRIALSTRVEKETSYDISKGKTESIDEIKCVEQIKNNAVKSAEKTYHQSKVSNNAVVSKINNCASSKELIPIMRPTHNVQPSQETLHEVKRRLRSLHNVLQTYQDTNQSPKRQKSTDRIDETDSFLTYPIVDISSEYFELDRSEESLSSLAEYSSSTSKTYRRSSKNVTLRDTCSKKISQHNTERSVRSDFSEAFVTTEYKESACEQNILNCNRNHELKLNTETNKDAIKTNTLINIRNNISEAVSENIFYILSPESKDIQTQNGISLKNKFNTKKFSNTFDKECDSKHQENDTGSQNSSQSKMSNNRENKSTTLLLQEALHFKNVLLTHSRKKYPTSNIKQGSTADEFPPMSNNNFPSMIIDVKEEDPVISNSLDNINQHYICLEMKQLRDLFPQSSKKANTLACEDERDTENQDIPETSSEYFSITDLAVQNNADVSEKHPVYEKVISITIPIDKINVKNPDEINMSERPIQTKTVLRNIQTHVSLQENLRENVGSNVDNVVTDKRSPRMLKLEDLILERVKNIRDYMDTFLQSQNVAIFKARRALQCQSKSDIFQCSDEASHIVVYNRSTASSSCSSTNQIVSSSKKSLDFLTDTWPNYIQEYKQEMKDVLNYSSDVYLKRNPGMLALVTPTKNKFSNKNDSQQSEVATGSREEEADLYFPITYSCKNDSKSTHRITNSITPRCEERITPNTENNKIDKGTTVDLNTDFHKRRKQTQIAESKPSKISYVSLDVANTDAKVIHITREEYLTKSNCNSISHSNSYFTDEEIINDIKMDDVSSESTSNIKYSHANVQTEIKQNVIKQQISVDERPDVNVAMPSKLSPDNDYSNLTIIIDSNLILDKSGSNYFTKAKTASSLTMLKKKDFIFNPEVSLLPLSLEKENKTLNTDGILLNNLKQNNEISVDTIHLSPQIECYSINPFQTSQIKAKSDMSLLNNRSKNLKVNLYPKKSHSFLMRHNTMDYINGILHQPCTKLHNNKTKCIKNKLRLTTQSKSVISPRRTPTKSCIPIFKNRLESSHRMKHRAQTRCPIKNPLTMLWGEKTSMKDHATNEEVAQSDNDSINKHLRVAETVSNFTKLNNTENILDKELENSNIICKDTSKKNSEILCSEKIVSLAIDKEHSDEKDINDRKLDDETSIMQHVEKIVSKEAVVISIMANDNLQKKYPADLFILNTKNISPATDLLIHKNKLWTITVGKTEKEVTVKPSVTDTCTSMSDLQ